MTQSPFVLPPEADEISLISDVTRWREEKRGRFPKRVTLGSKQHAWRRSELMEWAADPEGWRARQRPHGEVA
jgi:prophage regulatory protein